MEPYSSDSSDSGSSADAINALDFSYLNLDVGTLRLNLEKMLQDNENRYVENTETLYLYHNMLESFPEIIIRLEKLKVIDISANNISYLPETLTQCQDLTSLIVKNNILEDEGVPKTLNTLQNLRELNLSGNNLTNISRQILELPSLKYLYLGGNRITEVPNEIWKLNRLQVLYLGGNLLTELPAEMGYLQNLHSLVLCQNKIESLPATIAHLKSLRTLLLHKNKLTTLPPAIVTLKGLMELSLRDNPLVMKFVRDMTYVPPTLLELAGRVIKVKKIHYEASDLPNTLNDYLNSAHHCLNQRCKGVYFDNRVEHIKFVDFCGKYRIPLLQYLCSPKCSSSQPAHCDSDSFSDSDSSDIIRRVLLG